IYEGVEIQVGSRCGAYYPVVRGLDAGDRVATAGSFLIDAETRLNPAAGSAYFSAGGPKGERQATTTTRPSLAEGGDARTRTALDKHAAADRRLAEAQQFCPIQGENRLGAMGAPFKLLLAGEPVFLCCKGCESEAREHPRQTVDKVHQFQARAKAARRGTGHD